MVTNFVNIFVGINILFRLNDLVIIMNYLKRKIHDNSYFIRLKKNCFLIKIIKIV